METVLYLATSRTSGKSYVGITTTALALRWQKHCAAAKSAVPRYHFHRALKRYGSADFEVVELARYTDVTSAKHAEAEIIHHLDLVTLGYNMTPGGEGMSGYKHTSTTRARMSEAARRRSNTTEARARLRAQLAATPISDTTRKLKSDNARRLWEDPDRAARMRVSFGGRTHTIASREKMAAAKRGRTLSPETRSRMSASHRARRLDLSVMSHYA